MDKPKRPRRRILTVEMRLRREKQEAAKKSPVRQWFVRLGNIALDRPSRIP